VLYLERQATIISSLGSPGQTSPRIQRYQSLDRPFPGNAPIRESRRPLRLPSPSHGQNAAGWGQAVQAEERLRVPGRPGLNPLSCAYWGGGKRRHPLWSLSESPKELDRGLIILAPTQWGDD